MSEQTVLSGLKHLPKPKRDQMIPLEQLKSDPQIQIRFTPGENTFGFQTSFNSTYTEGLKARIIEEGCVLVPLTVWKTAEGEYTVIRGNTRLKVCRELINDPTTPQGVMAAIKKLKCDVYEGITRQDALALVNDQDQQRYNKADFVNLCWKLASAGWPFYEIALQYTDMYAEYVGTVQAKNKLAEFRTMTNHAAKLEFVKTWARGALDQGILLSQKLGLRVQKAFLLKAAELSNLLSKDDEKPEFNPLKGDRLKALKKIKEEKGLDSVEFNDEINKYSAVDKGEVVEETKSRPTVKMLEGLQQGVKSEAFKVAYKVALGEKPDNAEATDLMAFRNESIMKGIEEILPSIKNDDIKQVLAMVLRSQSPVEFTKMIAKYC